MLGKIAVAGKVIETLIKPKSPDEGPPLPESLNVPWPDFLKSGIQNLKKNVEGITGRKK